MQILAVANENTNPERARERLERFAREEDAVIPILLDNGSVAQAYGVSAVPAWALIDAHGHLIRFAHGRLPTDELDELLEEAKHGHE